MGQTARTEGILIANGQTRPSARHEGEREEWGWEYNYISIH